MRLRFIAFLISIVPTISFACPPGEESTTVEVTFSKHCALGTGALILRPGDEYRTCTFIAFNVVFPSSGKYNICLSKDQYGFLTITDAEVSP